MLRVVCQRLTMILLLLIIYFSFTQSDISTVYVCNSSASCGCSIASTTVNRIVNGETAETGAWAWMVSLRIGSFLCGGSILSPLWIITAAHCVEDATAPDITVYAGSNNVWSGSEIKTASYFTVHPNYITGVFLNDIALIKLTSPMSMRNSRVRTICLPSVNSAVLTNSEWPDINTTVVAVGWGRLNESGSLSSTLQQVTLKTIDYRTSTCRSLIYNHQVQLCATVPDGSKDTCQGDSGGPLMMFSSNHQWILVGLTSYGEGCAQQNFSGVYTRVVAFQDWINSTMNIACIQIPSLSFLCLIILIIFKIKLSNYT